MLLLLVAAAVLAFTGVSALREGGLLLPEQWAEEITTLPPVVLPAQLARAGQLRYHYGALSESEQAAYDDILERLPGFPDSIKVKNLNVESIERVFSALVMDQPLLFQISTVYYNTRSNASGLVTAFLPRYNMDRETYAARCEELAQVCESFTVPQGGTDFDCELALHDQLVRLCSYSAEFTKPEKSTAYGALVEGSASCEGYSRAMQLLLDLQGIPCYIVTGKAGGTDGDAENHAWNKVRIGGEWYHLDATWDDPVTKDNVNITSHAYFNLTDREMGLTHEIKDAQNPCTALGANYYVRKGLHFTTLDRAAEDTIAKALRAAMGADANAVELRFSDAIALEEGLDYLVKKQRVYRILGNAALDSFSIKTDTVYCYDVAPLAVVRIVPIKK